MSHKKPREKSELALTPGKIKSCEDKNCNCDKRYALCVDKMLWAASTNLAKPVTQLQCIGEWCACVAMLFDLAKRLNTHSPPCEMKTQRAKRRPSPWAGGADRGRDKAISEVDGQRHGDKGWEDGSGAEMFVMQMRGSKFDPQRPYKSWVQNVYNPSAEDMETGAPWSRRPASLAELVSSAFSERPCLTK